MATGTQVEVVMPQMGVSVSEGTITKWLKSEGEPIARDEALLEISTDKVDTEIPSPAEGVLAQILVQEGATVEVGTVLAVIAPQGAAVSAPEAPAPEAPAPEPATEEAAEEAAAVSSSEGDAPVAPAPPPPASSRRAAACRRAGVGQRPHLRLTRRRADRVRAWRRSERRAGDGDRRPRDQEGHPGVRRGRRTGRGAASRPSPFPHLSPQRSLPRRQPRHRPLRHRSRHPRRSPRRLPPNRPRPRQRLWLRPHPHPQPRSLRLLLPLRHPPPRRRRSPARPSSR